MLSIYQISIMLIGSLLLMLQKSINKGTPITKYSSGLYAWISQTVVLCYIMITICDTYFNTDPVQLHPKAIEIGYFMIFYLCFLFISRIYYCGSCVLYEYLWCCNVGMIFASIGLLTNRPILISLSCFAVALDQLCWWIDLILYLIFKKHIIGVMKFLSHPKTKLIQKITSFHHWWFIPLCMFSLNGYFPTNTFIASCIFTTLSSFFSFFTCPKHVLRSISQKILIN